MSFFTNIKRKISGIQIVPIADGVRVENINARLIHNAIAKFWSSQSVPDNMLRNVKMNSFEIETFFMPDVLFTLKQMATVKTRKMLPVQLIVKIHEKLLSDTWLGKTLEDYPTKLKWDKLNDLHFTPKEYQSEFLKNYDQLTQKFRLNGFLLNGAAGSGKTAASLMLAHMLGEDFTVIVAPKNAIYQVWESHMGRVFKTPQTYWIADSNKPYNGQKYLIVHYERLDQLTSLTRVFSGKRVTIILDESHNLNTIDSLRTEEFLKFCATVQSKNILWMSGTPFKAITKEAVPMLRSFDPSFTPSVEQKFKKIYKDKHDRGVEIIRNRLGFFSFLIEKKELKLLPPVFEDLKIEVPNGNKFTLDNIRKEMEKFVTERTRYYENRASIDSALFYKGLDYHEGTLKTKEEKQLYQAYRSDLKEVIKSKGDFWAAEYMKSCNRYEKTIYSNLPSSWRNEWREVRSAVKYVLLKVQGEALGRILGGYRIEAHVELCKKINYVEICESTTKKTVVFSTFQKVLEQIGEVLKDTDLSPLFVYGQYTKNLTEIVKEFGSNEDANPLCATYASLSTAVPLVMADTMILVDVPWRDYVLSQAVSRIHRLDSDTQTTIYRCTLDTGALPNISTRTIDILQWSQQQVADIIGIKSPYAINPNDDSVELKLEEFNVLDDIEDANINFYFPSHYLPQESSND